MGFLHGKPYFEIVKETDSSAFDDFCGDDSYNGIYTVKDKVLLGKEYGGVIIWAVNYDTPSDDEYSLLRVIRDVIQNEQNNN